MLMPAQKLSNRFLPEKDFIRLQKLLDQIAEYKKTAVGYPCNHDFDYSDLTPFLAYSINNIGDPFYPCNYKMNTHEFEREVIRFFAELAELPEAEMWGYVTNGGTEGNLYGLFLAREAMPGAIVYYSEATHYSVEKSLRVLNLSSLRVRQQKNGEMDYEHFSEVLAKHRDQPTIVLATVGTTMTGAVDNIPRIKEILNEQSIAQYYIHVDAALSGMIMPFVPDPQPWNFTCGIDSIAVSGHKLIGSPIPCGIVLAKKANMERIEKLVEYVGTEDSTLSGSRDALTPLFLWYAIKRHGKAGFKKMVEHCLETAEYAVKTFNTCGIKARRSKNGNTISFPKPSRTVLDRWQIAVYGGTAHIITMPTITRKQIDQLAKDIVENPN